MMLKVVKLPNALQHAKIHQHGLHTKLPMLELYQQLMDKPQCSLKDQLKLHSWYTKISSAIHQEFILKHHKNSLVDMLLKLLDGEFKDQPTIGLPITHGEHHGE